LKRFERDKHVSLLRQSVNLLSKKFNRVDTSCEWVPASATLPLEMTKILSACWSQCYKTFFSSPEKLERFVLCFVLHTCYSIRGLIYDDKYTDQNKAFLAIIIIMMLVIKAKATLLEVYTLYFFLQNKLP